MLEKRGHISSLRFSREAKRRGQVTIFIVVGLIILFGIAVYFFVTKGGVSLFNPSPTQPRLVIEQCLAQAVQPSVNDVLDYGGMIIPRHFIRRHDHAYNYLCYTDLYYTKCYSYYPMLHLIAEQQIRDDSIDRVKQCFDDLINDYRERGYDVTSDELKYNVEVVPGSIRLNIEKPVRTSKEDSVNSFKNFNTKMPSDLYELIFISKNIVNQEAEYCYFENNGFMIMYPKYNITRFDLLESKIYEVQNRQTKEVFKFAIRSCPYAPGIWHGGLDPETIGSVRSVEDIRREFNVNDAGSGGGGTPGSLDYN